MLVSPGVPAFKPASSAMLYGVLEVQVAVMVEVVLSALPLYVPKLIESADSAHAAGTTAETVNVAVVVAAIALAGCRPSVNAPTMLAQAIASLAVSLLDNGRILPRRKGDDEVIRCASIMVGSRE
ncbi:hypothetical protein PBS_34380 [Paraburkholderia sp. 2C]